MSDIPSSPASEQFKDIEFERDQSGIVAALHMLLEDHLANGLEWVRPEDIGALTAAPILSDEIVHDERSDVSDSGRVYWYPRYQVDDEIEMLRRHGLLIFEGVD